jgi:hypothetical protein
MKDRNKKGKRETNIKVANSYSFQYGRWRFRWCRLGAKKKKKKKKRRKKNKRRRTKKCSLGPKIKNRCQKFLEHYEIMFPMDGSIAIVRPICRAYTVSVVARTLDLDAQKHPLTIGVGETHVLIVRPGCPEASTNNWCRRNTCVCCTARMSRSID